MFLNVLWSPEFVPQITGGFCPVGLRATKVSVRHCEAGVAVVPPAITTPFVIATVDTVEVLSLIHI